MGPSNYKPIFSFGKSQTYEGASRPSPTPLIFSSPRCSASKVSILKPKMREVALGVHKNDDHEQLGIFLSRQSYSGRGGNDQVDQAGPDGGMGLVRLGVDDSLEEFVPSHRGEQEVGIPTHEGRSLGSHTKSMVEVPFRPACSLNPSSDQLGSICNKIKFAPFEKIALRSRARRDSLGDNGEKVSSGNSSGMHDVGQSPPSEITLVRRAKDESCHPHQSNPGEDVDNQALNHYFPRKHDGEKGIDGSMEVEGHNR